MIKIADIGQPAPQPAARPPAVTQVLSARIARVTPLVTKSPATKPPVTKPASVEGVTKPKGGRPTKGARAMTPAERQAKRRAAAKVTGPADRASLATVDIADSPASGAPGRPATVGRYQCAAEVDEARGAPA